METWITILCVIKKAFKEKTSPVENMTLDEGAIKTTLPKQYHYLVAVFSKHALNTMPPSRHCDNKIRLDG